MKTQERICKCENPKILGDFNSCADARCDKCYGYINPLNKSTMKNNFPFETYENMIKELRELQKDHIGFADNSGSASISHTIKIMEQEMKWYSEQNWLTEEDIREEFGRLHQIKDNNVIAWEELGNMLLGEQISYMAEHLGVDYYKKAGAWC